MLDDIQPRPIKSPMGSVVIWSAISFVLGFFAWAGWAEIDQISRAPGMVIPAGRLQVVQAEEQGVIEHIYIELGSLVRKGDVLVQFERDHAQAAVSDGVARKQALEASLARLDAELSGSAIVFSEDIPRDLQHSQRELYERRVKAHREDVDARRELLALVERELEANKPLLESGDIGLAEVMRLERSVVEVRFQLANSINAYFQELQQLRVDTENELKSAVEALTQREIALAAMTLEAPVSGFIKNIGYSTIGGVVNAGETVVEIVPVDDELVVEARLSPADIAHVQVGHHASVIFDTYDVSIYGSASGVVNYIAPDSMIDERGAMTEVYFPVRISLSTESMFSPAGEMITIIPGMTGSVEIKTGKKTILSFLFKPLLKTLSRAFGER